MTTHALLTPVLVVALGVMSTSTHATGLYADFPVTVKGYGGAKTSSVSYSGQTARHLLHESLKKLAGTAAGTPDAALEATMLSYYDGSDGSLPILAPASNGEFSFTQTLIDEVSAGKNLSGKTYAGAVSAWPGNQTGAEIIRFWISKAAAAHRGYDLANGYNYPQLISKFIMGAVFYNQIADVYLDENLRPDTKPNDQPYKSGAAYTGKEHSWDEAFGYFGAAAHTSTLSANQSYELAKRGTESDSTPVALRFADHDGNGSVDYRFEMTYALAYYAASYDKGGRTSYLSDINQAFLEGRKLLASANGEKLSTSQLSEINAYAETIKAGLEAVLAESVFKYAGKTFEDIGKLESVLDAGGDAEKVTRDYIKHWGELKGFAMALQVGGKDLGATAVKLNRLIGAGPVLANISQVTDIDSAGNYVKDQGPGLDEYALHMLKVQNLMVEVFGVQARNSDQLSHIGELMEQLGGGESAEND